MDRDRWLEEFAREAGVEPPTAEQVEQLLALAGVAAHASERTAAPIACWLSGRSQLTLPQLQAAAARVGEAQD